MMGRVPIAKKESSASSCERKTHGFEFDLELFLKNLLSHRNKDRPFICEADRVIAICDRVRSLMEADQCLATMSPPCTVVGDIHGQFTDLLRLLMSRSKEGAKQKKRGYGFSSERWVFLGDYVDRGPQSLHCIMTMFTLKVIYPRNFVLLRGNHETKAINCAYGFMQEVQMVFDESDRGPMWEKFNEVFAWMPLACLIGGKILCMHGGISEALRSLNDIVAIKRPVHDVNTCKLAQDLLWADPCEPHLVTAIDEVPRYLPNKVRGLSVTFNEAAVNELCKRLNVQMVVRAHQMMNEGYKFFANKKLITIFSAPCYMGETKNRGAVLRVTVTGVVSVVEMRDSRPMKKTTDQKVFEDEVTRGVDDKPPSESAKTGKLNSSSSSKSNSESQ